MGFQIKVNDEVVKELDVDPRLVESVTVGVDRLPVQFAQDSVNLVIGLKSLRDAEYIQALESDARAVEEAPVVKKKTAKKAAAKKAVAKKAVAKKAK